MGDISRSSNEMEIESGSNSQAIKTFNFDTDYVGQPLTINFDTDIDNNGTFPTITYQTICFGKKFIDGLLWCMGPIENEVIASCNMLSHLSHQVFLNLMSFECRNTILFNSYCCIKLNFTIIIINY